MKLTHIRLLVTDFSGCYRFYRDILGLTLLIGDENGPYASFSGDGAEIALFSRDAMADAVGTSALPTVVDAKDKAALIIAVPDVDAAYQAVVARGGVFVNAPFDQQQWMVRCAHLRDPDGNLIELNKEMSA
jgi:lactoylglutathione lyase